MGYLIKPHNHPSRIRMIINLSRAIFVTLVVHWIQVVPETEDGRARSINPRNLYIIPLCVVATESQPSISVYDTVQIGLFIESEVESYTD